jgi:uncharacterized protein (DUF4415 family)
MVRRSRAPFSALSSKAKKQLEALAKLPDEMIDYSDAPAASESFWKGAIGNPHYKPVKQQLTIRLDADLVAWLRDAGKGYQTRINDILRREMLNSRLQVIHSQAGSKKLASAKKTRIQATVPQQSTTAARRLR